MLMMNLAASRLRQTDSLGEFRRRLLKADLLGNHGTLWHLLNSTLWLQLFKNCTSCQSLRGSSTSCACWFTSYFWDTRRNISQTFWHRLPIFHGRSTLRASSCGNLVMPRTRRWIGDRAFSVAAPRAWNRLPTELKLLWLMDLFRRDLKTFLFDSVYRHQDTNWLCNVPSVF